MTAPLPAWSEPFEPGALEYVPASPFPTEHDWLTTGTGEGVRVAVVDSGVDFDHPWVGGPHVDGLSLSWDRDAQEVLVDTGQHGDLYGHGTACAGVIRRYAPSAELVSVRVLGERLTGKGQVFAAGLERAVEGGARVVNLSLSTGRSDFFGLFHEIADRAAFRGVVLVCAMNNVATATYPGQYASVISVAACRSAGDPTLYANARPPADFGAPGIDVEVAWSGGGTIVATGNSFAAPHVAGLCAQLLSCHPQLTPYQVKSALRAVALNAR